MSLTLACTSILGTLSVGTQSTFCAYALAYVLFLSNDALNLFDETTGNHSDHKSQNDCDDCQNL